jgi:hypothetical protein
VHLIALAIEYIYFRYVSWNISNSMVLLQVRSLEVNVHFIRMSRLTLLALVE